MPDVLQNIPLALLTHSHILKAPLPNGVFVLTKHTFARTRNIRQKDIHLPRQSTKFCREILRYYAMRSTCRKPSRPLLHVFGKNLAALGNRFITDKKRAIRYYTLQKCALTTRSSTKIKCHQRPIKRHKLFQNLSHIHRRCLLHIICPSMKQWVESKSRTVLQIESTRAPRNLLKLWTESKHIFNRHLA